MREWSSGVAGSLHSSPPRVVYESSDPGGIVYAEGEVKMQVTDSKPSARVPAFTRISPAARKLIERYATAEGRTFAEMLRILAEEACTARQITAAKQARR